MEDWEIRFLDGDPQELPRQGRAVRVGVLAGVVVFCAIWVVGLIQVIRWVVERW